MEDLPEIQVMTKVRDKRFYWKSLGITITVCLTGFILIFVGFLIVELSLLGLLSMDYNNFGEGSLFAGIVSVIIAPFLLLCGYPILINLYKRSQV